uniref:Uncharacterized protein n=1 Tax=Tanacetum cinerariifolium TaxID=118510 RepID=A0A699I7R3_TANCI|nr:hypothetical protein [Tanacetum cinerariifolium]
MISSMIVPGAPLNPRFVGNRSAAELSQNILIEVPSFNAEKEKQTTIAVSESDKKAVNEANTVNEANSYDFEEVLNEAKTVSESDKSNDSQDSNFIVDEDNLINEVEVNMLEFYQNINKDVEWVRYYIGNLEVAIQMHVEESYDLDYFDIDIEYDSDIETSSKRKKGLRALRREHENNSNQSKNKGSHFFVGKEFVDKKDATSLVTSQDVATSRQLYVWKNDKVRVRVVRRESALFLVIQLGASGLSSPSKSNLKQVNGKWVKDKRDESGSAHGINKVGGMRIKVGDDRDLIPMSNFTFISERQKGIIPEISQVFHCVEYRFCVRHIHENMKAKWRGKQFKELVWKCASATTMPYFDKQMDKLKRLDEGRAYCDVLLNKLCEVFCWMAEMFSLSHA